ncbi:MAG: hypothetical protein AB2807_09260 [Candidatus Sedimenticola endophacoides]
MEDYWDLYDFPFVWQIGANVLDVGGGGTRGGTMNGVTADGTTAYEANYDPSWTEYTVWEKSSGFHGLDLPSDYTRLPPAGFSYGFWGDPFGVSDIADDGVHLAGSIDFYATDFTEAFIDLAIGQRNVGVKTVIRTNLYPGVNFPVQGPSINAMSGDGTAVVGKDNSAAFRWSYGNNWEYLESYLGAGFSSNAYDVSEHGHVVVGSVGEAEGSEAFIWDAVNGMRSLQRVLTDIEGLDLTGWTLTSGTAISHDGRTIVGTGINPEGAQEPFWARLSVGTIPSFPVLDQIGDRTVSVGESLEFYVVARKADGTIPQCAADLSILPLDATIVDNGNGSCTFSWIPKLEDVGIYRGVLFLSSDDDAAHAESISITVLPPNGSEDNSTPFLRVLSDQSLQEGTTLQLNVAAHDIDDDLIFLESNATALLPGAVFEDHGDGTGTLTWESGLGDVGIHKGIVFSASDGKAKNTQAISIEVLPSGTGTPGAVSSASSLEPIGNARVRAAMWCERCTRAGREAAAGPTR